MSETKAHYFRVDIREPYMGNTLPLKLIVLIDVDGVRLRLITSEGIIHDAHPVPIQEFND